MTTTTKFWQWTEIWSTLQSQLGLANNDFIDEAEMMIYANEAIDECEDIIHSLNEEYFLMRTPLALVNGTDSYDLPSKIYATKIRSIIYYSGTDVYEIRRIPTLRKFLEYRLSRANGSTGADEQLEYFPVNATPGDPQLLFTPIPSGGACEIWHYRQANRFVDEDDLGEDDENICDLPECVRYVFDYCHERFAWKVAAGSARHQTAITRLEKTKERMILKLKPGSVDGNEEIEADFSAYEEHE